jgi:hypothetical protein
MIACEKLVPVAAIIFGWTKETLVLIGGPRRRICSGGGGSPRPPSIGEEWPMSSNVEASAPHQLELLCLLDFNHLNVGF